MINVAAMTLLLNNRHGGLGLGSRRSGGGRDNEDIEDRYGELEAARDGMRIDGTSVLTAYLDGRCKLTAFGESTDAKNLFGEYAWVRDVQKAVSQYKAEAEKRLNMITPPSFMEKVMVLRRSIGYTKAGQALNTSTLGLTAVAAGMVSLAARSYGRAKGFVLEKLGGKEKSKLSFSERLTQLKRRVDLKDDLKKLNKFEKSSAAVMADDNLRCKAGYHRYISKKTLTDSRLLDEYLRKSDEFIQLQADGCLKRSSWFGGTHYEKVPMKDVEQAMQKTQAGIEMIEPASGMEKILKAADSWVNDRNINKPVNSSLTQVLSAVVGKAVDGYIAAREKKDPSFKGRLSLYSRFAEINKRNELKKDAVKLRALHHKMTGR